MSNYEESVGLLKRGTIVKYNSNGTIQVQLTNNSAVRGQYPSTINVPAPHSLSYNNGSFIGTLPSRGTPVIVGQGRGGEYHFVSFVTENPNTVPNLEEGVILLHSNDDTKIALNDNDNSIRIGSSLNNVHINSDLNVISTNMNSSYMFTQAGRHVEGVVKRDKEPKSQYAQSLKLENEDYEKEYKVIGMDPFVSTNSQIKNPPFVEQRDIIYEFQYDLNIEDDLTEATKYGRTEASNKTKANYSRPNRRLGRADTLSLSLVAPNFLMETVKGTVVDIFGNILDLNRFPLPVGKDNASLDIDKSADKAKAFYNIKNLERRSLAYHFEINARKDLTNLVNNEFSLPDVASKDNYARSRSRFFIDIDKEGQFKINVPASSETGNIPLLTRYENFSTVSTEDNNNPHKLIFREDNLDIFHDSFAAPPITKAGDTGFEFDPNGPRGSISINDENGGHNIEDRISRSVIKHGTAYHDILKTCILHQSKDYLRSYSNYFNAEVVNRIDDLKDVVSNTIDINAKEPKAGGRSGLINLDGSIELNIGANSIDRQSIWLDTAGGVVYNIGQDVRGRSVVASTTGDFILQVGGFTVEGDSRFKTTNLNSSSIQPSILDLRIMTSGGHCHMIRCDDYGITILTPGSLNINARGDLKLTSNTKIIMKAPHMELQDRPVANGIPASI